MSILNTGAVNESIATPIPSASTIDPWPLAALIPVTGTTAITGCTQAPKAGVHRTLLAQGEFQLTSSANFVVTGGTQTVKVGDFIDLYAETTTKFLVVPKGRFADATFTQGSIFFVGPTVVTQNNANLFWDNTNTRLGIGTSTPQRKLTVVGPSGASGNDAGVLSLTVGTGVNTDHKLQFGSVDGSYSWIQAVKPTYDNMKLSLNPSGGNVGIGTTSPSTALHVVGTVLANDFQSYYGVSWNESTDTYTRTGLLSSVAVASKPSDTLLPIQSAMRRCLVFDNGTVNYYLSPTDSTKKADGTAADLTGAHGQVMVEIPKFYYRYSFASNVHTWNISQYPLSGFTLHPAFKQGTTVYDYVYVGAYEGILYDTSGAAYVDYTSAFTIDWAADVLSSVSAKKPVTNGTRAQFRSAASRRGSNWFQYSFDIASAIQLLYLTEYASFNSQSMIGAGISNVADWQTYNNYYPIAPSGNSNAIGNASGNTAGSASAATEASKYLSYRGIENLFGHIWKFVDGININNAVPYVTNIPTNFADDTATNYTALTTTAYTGNSTTNGYQNTLAPVARGFLPTSVGALASTKITDYYWYGSGWRALLLGGYAHNGAYDGAFSFHAYDASSTSYSSIGGRLCYIK